MLGFEDAELDLTKLDGRVIAVTGINGSGKSTFLELALPGVLYRECPTRGPIAKLAVTRDAFIESRINNGLKTYTICQYVDAQTGKGNSLVMEVGNKKPLLEKAGVREYGEWAAKHLTEPAVLYSSSFIPQQSEGLIDLKKGERKAVLLRALGIERWERLALAAHEQATTAKTEVERLAALLEAEKSRTNPPASARESLATYERVLPVRVHALTTARQMLEAATRLDAENKHAREAAERRQQLNGQRASLLANVADLETRIGDNRALLAREPEINAAVKADAELALALDDLQKQAAEKQSALKDVDREIRTLAADIERVKSKLADFRDTEENALTVLQERAAIEGAVVELKEVERLAQELTERIAGDEKTEHDLSSKLLTHKDDRIEGLRSTLLIIGDSATNPADSKKLAAEGIADDELKRLEATVLPDQLDARRASIREQKSKSSELAGRARRLDLLAAKMPILQVAEKELEKARADIERADAELREKDASRKGKIEEFARGQAEQTALTAEHQRVEQARTEYADILQLVPKLEPARARLEELEAAVSQAREQRESADQALAGLPAAETVDADLPGARKAVAEAEAAEREARAAVTRAQLDLEMSEAGDQKIKVLTVELEKANTELTDWMRLAQDLGRDGLQAIEIGNAIPEINELANDLLHQCHGPRFTVELRTDRLNSTGKKLIEDLVIVVYDSEKGTEHEAETYSGGERVILSEALSGAITTLACRKNGIERPVLIRDESGAALDAESGRVYVEMLRKLVELTGSERCLFITHNPDMQEMADARITIKDGKVVL